MYTSILKVTALFYFMPIVFAMPQSQDQDHIGNFFSGLVETVQDFSFEGAGKHIDQTPQIIGEHIDEAGRHIEDFTFEEAGENIDQIVRDIRNIAQRNIAQRGHRNSAHH